MLPNVHIEDLKGFCFWALSYDQVLWALSRGHYYWLSAQSETSLQILDMDVWDTA